MGNCLRHESSTVWGGEDWEFPAAEDRRRGGMSKEDAMMDIEEEGLLKYGHHDQQGFVTTSTSNFANYGNYSTSTSTTTEVKIKITKKQLEELLGKVDVKDMSVQQVLAQLVSVSDGYQTQQLRSWRPALQSIPEVN